MKLSTGIMAFCLAIPSLSVHASLSDLTKEFIDVNSSVQTNKTNIELSRLGLRAVEVSKSWALTGSGTYADSNLEPAFSFSSTVTDTKTTKSSVALSKSSFWGGEFSFSNTLNSIESGSTGTKTNGFSQTISYSQDIGANFLGRNDKLDIEIADATYKATKMSAASLIEADLFTFASAYSAARLRKSLYDMQKRAMDRALKREILVKRRVKDGLRERVDLYSAKAQTLTTKEEVQNAKANFLISLDSISQSVHRVVKDNEVDSFNFKSNNFAYLPKGELTKNKSVQTLDLQIKSLKSKVHQDTNNIFPSISLDTSYSSNDYDAKSSEALSNGIIGSDANEVSIGVNVTWTIGNEAQKNAKAINNIQLKLAQHKFDKTKVNISQTEKLFKERISLINLNLKSVTERRELVIKKLNEYNRLYKRGRADLEQVIRAEEDLINTEISFARYLSSREGLIYGLAGLYGTLTSELTQGN